MVKLESLCAFSAVGKRHPCDHRGTGSHPNALTHPPCTRNPANHVLTRPASHDRRPGPRTRRGDSRHLPPDPTGRLHSFWTEHSISRSTTEAHRRSLRPFGHTTDYHDRPGRWARLAIEAHRQ